MSRSLGRIPVWLVWVAMAAVAVLFAARYFADLNSLSRDLAVAILSGVAIYVVLRY